MEFWAWIPTFILSIIAGVFIGTLLRRLFGIGDKSGVHRKADCWTDNPPLAVSTIDGDTTVCLWACDGCTSYFTTQYRGIFTPSEDTWPHDTRQPSTGHIDLSVITGGMNI